MIGQPNHLGQIERANRKILPVIQLTLGTHVSGKEIKVVEYCESDSLSPPNGERVGVRGKYLKIKHLNEEQKSFPPLFHMHRLVKQLRQMAG